MRTKQPSLWIAWLALLASPAQAVDGVREINQICAETTGCFTGDTPGYPVTITIGGSYRLTGNLPLPNPSTDGILVSAADVSIDLNGFAIWGITDCPSPAQACTNPGSGRGVATTDGVVRNLSLRNGTVAGMGADGVTTGRNGRVEDLRAISNGNLGIFANAGSEILRCTVSNNGFGGIVALNGSLVADNTVTSSGGTQAGIVVNASIVRGNSVNGNNDDGIRVNSGSLVLGNSVTFNSGDGIEASDRARITDNVSMSNFGYGIRATGVQAGYSGNTMAFNLAGTVSGGLNLGGNQCDAAATCP